MAKNTRWAPEDMRKKNLIQVNGGDFVKASTQVATGKVEKIIPGIPTKPSVNRRVKNTVKVEQDGVKFASRLELFLYTLLKEAGIPFQFQRKIRVQDGFMFGKEKIRPIVSIIDFWLPKHLMLIDSKGFQLADGKLKFKLLKKHLVDKYPNTPITIEMPANQQQCRDLVNRLKYETP